MFVGPAGERMKRTSDNNRLPTGVVAAAAAAAGDVLRVGRVNHANALATVAALHRFYCAN